MAEPIYKVDDIAKLPVLSSIGLDKDSDLKLYFQSHLGLTSEHIRGRLHIEALQNPTKYLDDRSKLAQDLLDTHIGTFKKTVESFTNAGHPPEIAKEYAAKLIQEYWAHDAALLDNVMPYNLFSVDLQGGRLGSSKKEATVAATGAGPAPAGAAPAVQN